MNRIKDLRIEFNLSQKELAKLCKTSQKSISSYEQNKSSIPSRVLMRASKFFEVTPMYLLGDSSVRKVIDYNEYLNLFERYQTLRESNNELQIITEYLVGELKHIEDTSIVHEIEKIIFKHKELKNV